MKEQFVANLEHLFHQNLKGKIPLKKAICDKAWEHFKSRGLPEKKTPYYQYFPLLQLYQETYEAAPIAVLQPEQYLSFIHPECRHSYVVFVNGQYTPSLSNLSSLPEEVVTMELAEAVNHYGNFLQTRFAKTLQEETDPFALLNLAFTNKGLFFYVPPKVEISTPIQCLQVITSDKTTIFHPRVHFYLGKGAQVEWVYDTHCVKDFAYCLNSVVDVALEEDAQFTQCGIVNSCKHGRVFEATRVTIKKEGQFNSFTCTTGAKSIRQDFKVALLGEEASCDIKSIALLNGHKQAHANVVIEHKAPSCKSNQLFKNILKDTSRCSFEGQIFVAPIAQKTEAYQLNNNLLLDDHVIANTKPNLIILADDVKASHGATITRLKDDLLFYCKTRGIDAETAKMLLISGFYLELLNEVSCLSMRQKMRQLAERSLR